MMELQVQGSTSKSLLYSLWSQRIPYPSVQSVSATRAAEYIPAITRTNQATNMSDVFQRGMRLLHNPPRGTKVAFI